MSLKHTVHVFRTLFILLSLSWLVACGSGNETLDGNDDDDDVVVVDPGKSDPASTPVLELVASDRSLNVGASTLVRLFERTENNSQISFSDNDTQWSVSSNIATLTRLSNSSVQISAVAAGTVSVSARNGDAFAQTTLQIIDPNDSGNGGNGGNGADPVVNGINFSSQQTMQFSIGQSKTVGLMASYSDGSTAAVTTGASWQVTSGANIVSVSNGTVTANAQGTATVQASYAGFTASLSVEVMGDGIVVHIKKPDTWNSVYVYLWQNGGSGQPNGEWPGSQINANGEWYTTFIPTSSFDSEVNAPSMVINDNGNAQAPDYRNFTQETWVIGSADGANWTVTNTDPGGSNGGDTGGNTGGNNGGDTGGNNGGDNGSTGDDFVISVKKPADWNQVNLYMWKDQGGAGNEPNGGWPGNTLSESNGWYTLTVADDAVDATGAVNVIANDNGQNQSDDFTGVSRSAWLSFNNGAWQIDYQNPEADMYSLSVTNGTGSGLYAEGSRVDITASAGRGQTFVSWSGPGAQYVGNTGSISTYIVMPGQDIAVEASFALSGGGSGGGVHAGKSDYDTQCATCHGDQGQGGLFNSLLTDSCAICGSNAANLAQYIEATMPAGGPTNCTGDCAANTADYIISVLNGSDAGGDVCADTNVVGKRQLRRLTREEYHNTIRDLIGVSDSNLLPDQFEYANGGRDATGSGYSNNASEGKTGDVLAGVYDKYAAIYADDLNINLRNFVSNCSTNRCVVEKFGLKAFRRPLTNSELNRYEALLNDHGEAATLKTFLTSPMFIYRSELGTDSNNDGIYELDNYEIASALSYLFWESMPDDQLLAAAASTTAFSTPAKIKSHAERLYASDKAKQSIGNFAVQWLEAQDLKSLTRDDPSFTDAIQDMMLQETGDFVSHVAQSNSSSFRELFTANYSVMSSQLANYYGLSGNGVVYYQGNRAGVLGHGAVQASKALNDGTSPNNPIKRGYFVRHRLLCQELPPPPDDAPRTAPPATSGQTTAERLTQLQEASGDSCFSCHQYLDDPGLAFENFDAVGKFRSNYDTAGSPAVETAGVIRNVEALNIDSVHSFADLAELSEIIADAESAKSCFTRQYFRYARGYREEAIDECAIEPAAATLNATGSVRDMMIAITQSDDFTKRQ